MSANDRQVAGSHYRTETGIPQHWDVVIAMGWDYLTGNATKYLWRLGKKGGPEKELEDLQKAIHYLEKKQEVLRAQLAQGVPALPGEAEPYNYGASVRIPKVPSQGICPTPPDPPIHGSMVRPIGSPSSKVEEYDGGPTRAYVNQD